MDVVWGILLYDECKYAPTTTCAQRLPGPGGGSGAQYGGIQLMIDLAGDMDPDTVRVGLTRFLLSQTTNGQRTGKQWTVSEIAAHLGAGPRAIRRSLHSSDREGFIRLERGRLVVTDVARLE
jgi:hypothetical protein